MVPPQPLPIRPHVAPTDAQLTIRPAQSVVEPPQPSPSTPHCLSAHATSGLTRTQMSSTPAQTLLCVRPQIWPSPQPPQSRSAPQPSATMPHVLPSASQVVGSQLPLELPPSP